MLDRDLVRRALAEDVGDGDATTLATVPAETFARAGIIQKEPGVIFGLEIASAVFSELDPEVLFSPRVEEGVWREGGEVAVVEGSARALLTAERTALNLLQRLSGVATATALAVREVAGTRARILDTRKTTPGLRKLEKAAVAAGGGTNHRAGLYDAILIKENHIAMAGGVAAAVEAARAARPDLPLEVEVRDMAEVDEALSAGAPRLLLDNMTPDQLREVVTHVAGRAELEASGGITHDRLREFAETGVDFISIGALTHSAPSLDLSLLLGGAPAAYLGAVAAVPRRRRCGPPARPTARPEPRCRWQARQSDHSTARTASGLRPVAIERPGGGRSARRPINARGARARRSLGGPRPLTSRRAGPRPSAIVPARLPDAARARRSVRMTSSHSRPRGHALPLPRGSDSRPYGVPWLLGTPMRRSGYVVPRSPFGSARAPVIRRWLWRDGVGRLCVPITAGIIGAATAIVAGRIANKNAERRERSTARPPLERTTPVVLVDLLDGLDSGRPSNSGRFAASRFGIDATASCSSSRT